MRIKISFQKTIRYLVLGMALVGFSAVMFRTLRQEKVIPVPYLGQRGTLESGCELISAIMVLRYYGCAVSVDDFAAEVPTSQLVQTNKGLVGEDPSNAFIGDPHSSIGLGCYAPVISRAMNVFLSGTGKHAVTLSGTNLSDLLSRYLAHGTPVILWATNNMRDPTSGLQWTVRETGKSFQWINGEHCLVLIGSDLQNCYFRDPFKTDGTIPFKRSIVEKCYRALGSQAVVVQ